MAKYISFSFTFYILFYVAGARLNAKKKEWDHVRPLLVFHSISFFFFLPFSCSFSPTVPNVRCMGDLALFCKLLVYNSTGRRSIVT